MDRMVPIRDGVRRATDIYRPGADGDPLPGPFPTLFCCTPYNKADRKYVDVAAHFTPRGYLVAVP